MGLMVARWAQGGWVVEEVGWADHLVEEVEVEEWEVETVEWAEALALMYHSRPWCTQADVAACSCMWSSRHHRMSTHTPEWPCSSSTRMMSSGSTRSHLRQDRRGMDALYAASQAGLCHSAADQAW